MIRLIDATIAACGTDNLTGPGRPRRRDSRRRGDANVNYVLLA